MSTRYRTITLQAVGVAVLAAIIFVAFLKPSEPSDLSGIEAHGGESPTAVAPPSAAGEGKRRGKGHRNGRGGGAGANPGGGRGTASGGGAGGGESGTGTDTGSDSLDGDSPTDSQYGDPVTLLLVRVGSADAITEFNRAP